MSTWKRGFTLIELLVVIAIIAILAAILFPVFAKAREKARQTACTSNERQIAVDILMWVQDHDEMFPATGTIWSGIKTDPGILVCPTRGKTVQNGYGYNKWVAGYALGDLDSPDTTILVADWNDRSATAASSPNLLIAATDVHKRHSGGAVFAYSEGHVAWSKYTIDDSTDPTFITPSTTTVYLKPILGGQGGNSVVLSTGGATSVVPGLTGANSITFTVSAPNTMSGNALSQIEIDDKTVTTGTYAGVSGNVTANGTGFQLYNNASPTTGTVTVTWNVPAGYPCSSHNFVTYVHYGPMTALQSQPKSVNFTATPPSNNPAAITNFKVADNVSNTTATITPVAVAFATTNTVTITCTVTAGSNPVTGIKILNPPPTSGNYTPSVTPYTCTMGTSGMDASGAGYAAGTGFPAGAVITVSKTFNATGCTAATSSPQVFSFDLQVTDSGNTYTSGAPITYTVNMPTSLSLMINGTAGSTATVASGTQVQVKASITNNVNTTGVTFAVTSVGGNAGYSATQLQNLCGVTSYSTSFALADAPWSSGTNSATLTFMPCTSNPAGASQAYVISVTPTGGTGQPAAQTATITVTISANVVDYLKLGDLTNTVRSGSPGVIFNSGYVAQTTSGGKFNAGYTTFTGQSGNGSSTNSSIHVFWPNNSGPLLSSSTVTWWMMNNTMNGNYNWSSYMTYEWHNDNNNQASSVITQANNATEHGGGKSYLDYMYQLQTALGTFVMPNDGNGGHIINIATGNFTPTGSTDTTTWHFMGLAGSKTASGASAVVQQSIYFDSQSQTTANAVNPAVEIYGKPATDLFIGGGQDNGSYASPGNWDRSTNAKICDVRVYNKVFATSGTDANQWYCMTNGI